MGQALAVAMALAVNILTPWFPGWQGAPGGGVRVAPELHSPVRCAGEPVGQHQESTQVDLGRAADGPPRAGDAG